MNKLDWYYSRFKTMSVPEIGFRISQIIQKQLEKRGNRKIDHSNQNYEKILLEAISGLYEEIPADLTSQFSTYSQFCFFGLTLDLTKKIAWQTDITSEKTFPSIFSKSVDTRSGSYGNAKVVWEFNRLQFLIPLAAKYSNSKNPADLDKFIYLLSNWIDENPYLTGINWYSNIEVNIRLIVWHFCWRILLSVPEVNTNQVFKKFATEKWLPSIYEHCVFSYRNPSKYSSANNHLISEYAGLFCATSLWNFNEAKFWNDYAKNGLEVEIVRQHSENGVNREEAAEYIQFITDFFLLPYAVAENTGNPFSEAYKGQLFHIINYIYNLLDQNGGYCKYGDEDDGKVLVTSVDPHFNNFLSILQSGSIIYNNGAFKISAGKHDFKNFLLWGSKGYVSYNQIATSPVARKSMFLEKEGHFIFRKQDDGGEIYLHFDVAPLGYLSIAAHGHADALSFTLSIDGHPFIVDPGTYTYYSSYKWRKYFLSTIAHNTITVDRQNQAYLAGPVMWLKHYNSQVTEILDDEEREKVTGTHDGYKNIGCEHQRSITFIRNDNRFFIEDKINFNNGAHLIEIPFHIHPDVEIERLNSHQWYFRQKKCKKAIRLTIDSKLQLEMVTGNEDPLLGWYSPSFLIKVPCFVITGKIIAQKSLIITSAIEILADTQTH